MDATERLAFVQKTARSYTKKTISADDAEDFIQSMLVAFYEGGLHKMAMKDPEGFLHTFVLNRYRDSWRRARVVERFIVPMAEVPDQVEEVESPMMGDVDQFKDLIASHRSQIMQDLKNASPYPSHPDLHLYFDLLLQGLTERQIAVQCLLPFMKDSLTFKVGQESSYKNWHKTYLPRYTSALHGVLKGYLFGTVKLEPMGSVPELDEIKYSVAIEPTKAKGRAPERIRADKACEMLGVTFTHFKVMVRRGAGMYPGRGRPAYFIAQPVEGGWASRKTWYLLRDVEKMMREYKDFRRSDETVARIRERDKKILSASTLPWPPTSAQVQALYSLIRASKSASF